MTLEAAHAHHAHVVRIVRLHHVELIQAVERIKSGARRQRSGGRHRRPVVQPGRVIPIGRIIKRRRRRGLRRKTALLRDHRRGGGCDLERNKKEEIMF